MPFYGGWLDGGRSTFSLECPGETSTASFCFYFSDGLLRSGGGGISGRGFDGGGLTLACLLMVPRCN